MEGNPTTVKKIALFYNENKKALVKISSFYFICWFKTTAKLGKPSSPINTNARLFAKKVFKIVSVEAFFLHADYQQKFNITNQDRYIYLYISIC